MSAFEDFVAAVERHTGRQGKRVGKETRLLCPAHDDHRPSLDVREGIDGQPVTQCRSHNCTFEAICSAIGWEPRARPQELDEVAYDYVDGDGRLLYQVVRRPGKKFSQRRPDGNGGYIWNLNGVERVLYRLPAVLATATAGDRIYVVEGEKDVAAIERAGAIATTNPMGQGNWSDDYSQSLRGADVVIVADKDAKGREHAKRVKESLRRRAGVASVIVEAAVGKDAADHLAAGFGLDEFMPVVSAEAAEAETKTVLVSRQITATPLSSIAMRSIEWYERPLWQLSAFQLLAGAKGAGKGTYLAGLGARISKAGKTALFVSTEDSTAIDLKPRLVAAGADIDRCYVIQQHVQLPGDVDDLRALALDLGGVGLLVIDPVANHIGNRNSNSDTEVRDAIAPLNPLADELGCLLIGVRHPGKDRSRGALASILGSTAWVDTPRAVVMIAVDDEDPAVRVIQVVAGNRSPNGAAQAFRIDAVDVLGLAEPITLAVELGESSKSVDELLAAHGTGESKTATARELILNILEDEGEQEADTLDARVARETGLAAQTIRNTRVQLGKEGLTKARPEKDEHGGVVCWKVFRSGAPR